MHGSTFLVSQNNLRFDGVYGDAFFLLYSCYRSMVFVCWGGGGTGEVDPRDRRTPYYEHGGGAKRLVHLEAAELGAAHPRVLPCGVWRGKLSEEALREARTVQYDRHNGCLLLVPVFFFFFFFFHTLTVACLMSGESLFLGACARADVGSLGYSHVCCIYSSAY